MVIYAIANSLWNPARERRSKIHYILVTQKIGPNLLPPPNYCLEISQNSVIQSTHRKCLLCTSTYCKLVQMCNQAMFCDIQGIDLRNPGITVWANVELFYFLLEHSQQVLYLCLLQYLQIQDTVINLSPPESSLFTHSSEKTWFFSELGRKNMKGT
jgi:hypothetical protein